MRQWPLLVAALLLASAWPLALPVAAQTDERCFDETRYCVAGRFREYWEQNGGLAVFGFPVSEARQETNRDTGQSYLTQWFERNRFEWHPENAAPYDVLLGRLGDDRLRQQGRDWQTLPGEATQEPGCLWFQQTQFNVCDQEAGSGFMTYWRTHGLRDPGLDAYGQSLALFGLPISRPRMETNASGDTVYTQWFERARFEYHPNNPPEHKVLLGLLGNEVRSASGPAPGPDAPGLVRRSPGEIALALGDLPGGFHLAEEGWSDDRQGVSRLFQDENRLLTGISFVASLVHVASSIEEGQRSYGELRDEMREQAGGHSEPVGGLGDEAFLSRYTETEGDVLVELIIIGFRRANATGAIITAAVLGLNDLNTAMGWARLMASRAVPETVADAAPRSQPQPPSGGARPTGAFNCPATYPITGSQSSDAADRTRPEVCFASDIDARVAANRRLRW